MEVPMIRWSRGADPTKCTKIVVVAPKDEMEPVNKAISQTMSKLKKLGYCRNGYEIINGVQPATVKQIDQDGRNPKPSEDVSIPDHQVEHPVVPIWTTDQKVSELIVSSKN